MVKVKILELKYGDDIAERFYERFPDFCFVCEDFCTCPPTDWGNAQRERDLLFNSLSRPSSGSGHIMCQFPFYTIDKSKWYVISIGLDLFIYHEHELDIGNISYWFNN